MGAGGGTERRHSRTPITRTQNQGHQTPDYCSAIIKTIMKIERRNILMTILTQETRKEEEAVIPTT